MAPLSLLPPTWSFPWRPLLSPLPWQPSLAMAEFPGSTPTPYSPPWPALELHSSPWRHPLQFPLCLDAPPWADLGLGQVYAHGAHGAPRCFASIPASRELADPARVPPSPTHLPSIHHCQQRAPFLFFPSAAARGPCSDSSHGAMILYAAMPVQKQQPSLALSSTPQHRHCPCLSAVQIPATSLAEHCPAAACSFASRVGCSTNRRSEPCPPASFRSPVRDDAFVFTPRVQQPRPRFDMDREMMIEQLMWCQPQDVVGGRPAE
ncbi:uncharacterized protein [Zea mays]|uniref:uncharacterized protein n=1 Tax=Zea mays TaxID=4577 RepID=UPI0016525AAD|nr:uncharacterized protein LOC109944137 [Zea mays]